MTNALPPAGDISTNANCGELLRVWRCADHICVMIDPELFSDQVEGYGRLLATLAVRLFTDVLTNSGGDMNELFAIVIADLNRGLAKDIAAQCPRTEHTEVLEREQLPIPRCALKDATSAELVRAWIYNPFGDTEMKFSVVSQENGHDIADLLLACSAEIANLCARSATGFQSVKYKMARFFRGRSNRSLASYIRQLILERALEYLDAFRSSANQSVTDKMQVDMDSKVLAELSKHGCPLDHNHEIDHAFVCDPKTVSALAEQLTKLGMTVASPRENGTWLDCVETAPPISMPKRTQQLHKLAKQFGAEYDGWGSACPSPKPDS